MNSVVMIEKGIPAPRMHQCAKFPFGEMEVGDSFFIAGVTSVSLHQGMKRHRPKRFVARKAIVGGIRGFRVWRSE